MIKSLCTTM